MKNWLKRNKGIWIGGLIGLIIGIFGTHDLSCIDGCNSYVEENISFLILIVFIAIGALIGFIIQKVRKISKR